MDQYIQKKMELKNILLKKSKDILKMSKKVKYEVSFFEFFINQSHSLIIQRRTTPQLFY